MGTMSSLFEHLDSTWGLCVMLLALSVATQLAANSLSSVAAGLMMAPVAQALASTIESLNCKATAIVVIFSCNMVLSAPFAPSHRSSARTAGMTASQFLFFGLPAQAITTAVVVTWTMAFLEE